MNPIESVRKAIEAVKGQLTKKQAKAVRRAYLREKHGYLLRHMTMTPDPKKQARNKARRVRQAARGYRLLGVADTEKFNRRRAASS